MTLFVLLYQTESVTQQLATVKNFYTLIETKNKMLDGVVPYPRRDVKASTNETGMEVEFR